MWLLLRRRKRKAEFQEGHGEIEYFLDNKQGPRGEKRPLVELEGPGRAELAEQDRFAELASKPDADDGVVRSAVNQEPVELPAGR